LQHGERRVNGKQLRLPTFVLVEAHVQMAEPKDTIVCVTGAAGFIGLHICKQLRERGYRVRGTVRSANDPKKTEHLKKFGVEIFEADLVEKGSFDDAVNGAVCDCSFGAFVTLLLMNEYVIGATYVIHTASPYHMKTTNPQKQLIVRTNFDNMNLPFLSINRNLALFCRN
jgi:nucleoside-diphosphate-sugar epimerase